jgi:signal transduction histidine kinase
VLSIKARQVAGVTSLVGAVVVAISALHLASLARLALEETASRGELLSRAIFQRAFEVVPDAPEPYTALRADPGLRSLLQSAATYSKNVTYAAIVDPQGLAIAHSFPALEGQPLPHAGDLGALRDASGIALVRAIYSDSTFEIRQPLEIRRPTVEGGNRAFGAIRIGVSPLLVRSELKAALASALQTAATALLVALAVSMLLAQWILRPIHVIKSGLSRLGKGELDVRLDLPPGDEFRELGTSFDALTKRLAAESAPPEYSQRLVAFGRLLTGLAHEVKNPLNAMMIHLELLRTKLSRLHPTVRRPAAALAGPVGPATPVAVASDPESDVLKHAGIIADEIRRLDQVLQGFLKFARPGELKRQPVAVEALLEDVARVVDPQAGGAKVELRVDLAPTLPQIQGDATMLGQALMNLALNAVQAMPDGGTLRLTARNGRRGRVELAVEDTGIGIAPEHLGRIFDLYFTTKTHGSGIGLSMVYRIIQPHDGDIEVESIPGKGTKFRLMLPVVKESEDAAVRVSTDES